MITSDKQQDIDNLILNLSDNEKLCLDAYLFNSANKLIAYKLCKGINKDIDTITLNQRANSWLQNRSVQAYIQKNKSIVLSVFDADDKTNEQSESLCYDKPSIIAAMTKLVQTTNDAKLKSDLLIKLSTLQGFNKEQPKQESETIRYYLPQRCDSCEFKPKI